MTLRNASEWAMLPNTTIVKLMDIFIMTDSETITVSDNSTMEF